MVDGLSCTSLNSLLVAMRILFISVIFDLWRSLSFRWIAHSPLGGSLPHLSSHHDYFLVITIEVETLNRTRSTAPYAPPQSLHCLEESFVIFSNKWSEIGFGVPPFGAPGVLPMLLVYFSGRKMERKLVPEIT
jgi:hypothetical protein